MALTPKIFLPPCAIYVVALGGVWRLVALLSAETCAWAGVVMGNCWRSHTPFGDKCGIPSVYCFCSSSALMIATVCGTFCPPYLLTSVGLGDWPSGRLHYLSWPVWTSVRAGWMVWLVLVPSGVGTALFVTLGFVLVAPPCYMVLGAGAAVVFV